MKIAYDLRGNKYGRLTPLDYEYRNKRIYWRCLCDCGNEIYVLSSHLKSGKISSCKCLQIESRHNKRTEHRIENNIELKYCSKCNTWININGFGEDKDRWDGIRIFCRKCVNIINGKSKRKNRNKILEKSREYHLKNRDKERVYRQKTKDRDREKRLIYLKKRRDSHPEIRLLDSLRSRMRQALLGKLKISSSLDLLGCDTIFLKQHIESQFDENMNWDNYGSYWEVDHIIPCAKFDFNKPEEQRECFHYSNLQPLEKIQNVRKNSVYDGVRYFYDK